MYCLTHFPFSFNIFTIYCIYKIGFWLTYLLRLWMKMQTGEWEEKRAAPCLNPNGFYSHPPTKGRLYLSQISYVCVKNEKQSWKTLEMFLSKWFWMKHQPVCPNLFPVGYNSNTRGSAHSITKPCWEACVWVCVSGHRALVWGRSGCSFLWKNSRKQVGWAHGKKPS